MTTGWLTAMHEFPGRRFFEWALVLPLAMPAYVMADVYTDFLQFVGPLQTAMLLTGGIAALIYPYLVRFLAVALHTVESSLGKITPNMDDAARSLGLGQGATLRRVHAPMLRGSLLTAGLRVFVDVMKELPATLVMRTFNFDTLATQA